MQTKNRFFYFFLGLLFITSLTQAQWVQTNGPFGADVYTIAVSGTNLFAGTGGGGVLISTNNGTNWTAVNAGLSNLSVQSLALNGANLFAGTWGGGVFLSSNNGASWTAVNTDLTNRDVRSLAVSGTNLFAGTLGGGVFLSTNNGTSWTVVNTGLTNLYVNSLEVKGSNLFAGTNGGGVFLSTNNGTSWTVVNAGLTNLYVLLFAVKGTNLFAGTAGGVFLSTNNGTNWTAVNTGMTDQNVWSLAVNGSNLFAGASHGGVFLSTNNGTSWAAVNTGLPNSRVQSLNADGTYLFAGTYGTGVWRRPLEEMIANMITLISPGSSNISGYPISTTAPSFFWNATPLAAAYGLQLFKYNNSSYQLLYTNENIISNSTILPSGTISDGSQYYWQVRAKVNNVWTPYSAPYYFTVSSVAINPILSLSSSSIQSGSTQTFNGSGFSRSKQVRIIASSSSFDTSLTVLTDNTGSFSKSVVFSNSGNHSVYCTDITTGSISNNKSFSVQQVYENYFVFTFPNSGYKAYANQPFHVDWSDKLIRGNSYPVSGSKRAYKYLIEESTDGGAIWQKIDSLTGYDNIDLVRSFGKSVSISQPVNQALIRVRDSYVPSRITETIMIQVANVINPNISVSFVWDKSYEPDAFPPRGVCADGTSRFYIKVKDPNNTIAKVKFSLSNDDNDNEARILGKLMAATNIATYDTEANAANSTSIQLVQPTTNNEYWCWYVAPDDFVGINSASAQSKSRAVSVKIEVEYSSAGTYSVERPIEVFRPLLILVYGLNGDYTTWSNYVQSQAITSKYYYYTLNIGNKAGFNANARLILGIDASTNDWEHTLPGAIQDFRKCHDIACSQVYYIGHSMGGDVLRFAETTYPHSFKNANNYYKGYINKCITLNTPHNGSAFANILYAAWPLFTPLSLLPSFRDKFFTCDSWGIINGVNDAVSDLMMHKYSFDATSYPAHVLAGDVLAGSENLTVIPESIVNQIGVNPTFKNWLWLLGQNLPVFGHGLKGILSLIEDDFARYSGTSISNSDIIVPLSSQLAGLSPDDDRVTMTNAFHSSVVGSPSIENSTASMVSQYLDIKRTSLFWGSLPVLQKTKHPLPALISLDKILVDTAHVSILSPHNLDTLFVDSTFNLSFSLSDTLQLKRISVYYQDKVFVDTLIQANYNYTCSTSNNYLDTQYIFISALYASADSTIISSKMIPVFIKSAKIASAIKAKSSFEYLLKNEVFLPVISIFYDTYIGEIGSNGTALDAYVANSDILAFNSQTKSLTAIKEGETYVIFKYGSLSDTVFFNVSGSSVTGADDRNYSKNGVIPEKYELYQNYPNPFNPTTTIKYSIPRAGFVSIRLFDILGREVKTLLNEEKLAGTYSIQFNGSKLASGIYFYKMQADAYVVTRKLVLIK